MKCYLRYLILGVLGCSSFLYTGCREEFDEVNLNSNAPEQVSPQFLLSNVLYQAAKNNSEEGWKAGNLLAQQTSNLEFLPIDRYDLGSNTRLWENTYRLLNDLESVREGAQGNTAYAGVALVMKANLAALLTDLYGDVPYTEAVQGRTNNLFTPAYDKQEAISTVGALFRDIPDGVNAHLMQYSELQFLLAEAALKGYISGSAAAYYQAGIQASFDYYRLPMPVGYLERPKVKLSGTDDLPKIMTQKWLSHFMNGYEAWLDIRRTGFPKLKVAKDNLNNNVYPVRFRYPESEQAANSEKYQAALAQAGPDTYNRKGWWESD